MITNISDKNFPLITLDNEQLFITQMSSRLIRKLIDVDTNLKGHGQKDLKMIKSTGSNSTLCDKQENKIPLIVQDRQPRPLDN